MFDHWARTIVLRHAALSIAAMLLCSCDYSSKHVAEHAGSGSGGQTQDSGVSHAGSGGHRANQGHSGTGGHTGSGGAPGANSAHDAGMDSGDVAMALDGAMPALDAAGGAGGDPASSHCLDNITDYTHPGPFEFDALTSGMVKLWVPRVPAGCKIPVVHFSNGTGAACSSYMPILEHLASHGFLTACYEDPSPDDGTVCMAALHTVFSEHAQLVAMKIGSAGQEVGGAVALSCLDLAEHEWGAAATYAGYGAAPQFGSGSMPDWMAQLARIRSPVFVFNGSEDFLVNAQSVRSGYELLQSEKYWYEASGAPHIPIPVSWIDESAVVFFRWKLLGDQVAGDYFAAMPDSDRWDLQERDPAP